jgi:hypothetical protein
LISSGRRGKLDKMMEGFGDTSGLADEEDGMIAAIPKNRAVVYSKTQVLYEDYHESASSYAPVV